MLISPCSKNRETAAEQRTWQEMDFRCLPSLLCLPPVTRPPCLLLLSGCHQDKNKPSWHHETFPVPHVVFLSNSRNGEADGEWEEMLCFLPPPLLFFPKAELDYWLGGSSWRHSCRVPSPSLFSKMCKALIGHPLFLQMSPGHSLAVIAGCLPCLNARACKVLRAALSFGSLEMMDAKRRARLVCAEIQDAACTGTCHSVVNSCIQPKSTSIWMSGRESAGVSKDEISFLWAHFCMCVCACVQNLCLSFPNHT